MRPRRSSPITIRPETEVVDVGVDDEAGLAGRSNHLVEKTQVLEDDVADLMTGVVAGEFPLRSTAADQANVLEDDTSDVAAFRIVPPHVLADSESNRPILDVLQADVLEPKAADCPGVGNVGGQRGDPQVVDHVAVGKQDVGHSAAGFVGDTKGIRPVVPNDTATHDYIPRIQRWRW